MKILGRHRSAVNYAVYLKSSHAIIAKLVGCKFYSMDFFFLNYESTKDTLEKLLGRKLYLILLGKGSMRGLAIFLGV